MSAGDEPDGRSAGSAIQVDRWEVRLPGVRYRGAPGDLGEEPPASWHQVWRQVHRHLMRLVSGIPRLLVEAIEGATRLARSTVPRRDPAKVCSAHAEADFWEAAVRRHPLDAGVSPRGQRQARRAIAAILERYRAAGHLAEIVAGPDGQPVLLIVGAEHAPPALSPPPITPARERGEPEGEVSEDEGMDARPARCGPASSTRRREPSRRGTGRAAWRGPAGARERR